VLSKVFSVALYGRMCEIWAGPSSISFTIPITTSPEATTLLSSIRTLCGHRFYPELIKELKHLAFLCEEEKVSFDDFRTIFLDLLYMNVTFANQCIPFFRKSYHILITGDSFLINSTRENVGGRIKTDVGLYLHFEECLQVTAAKPTPLGRVYAYLDLAYHQMERGSEAFIRVEKELEDIESPSGRISAEFKCAIYCSRINDEEGFSRFASSAEERMAKMPGFERTQLYLGQLDTGRAIICLRKGDVNGFKKWVSSSEKYLSQISDPNHKELLQMYLNYLKVNADVFSKIGQIEQHALKV